MRHASLMADEVMPVDNTKPGHGSVTSPQSVAATRDRLVAELRKAYDQADAATGSLVWISGEAGMGKTSLVDAFVRSLGSGPIVVWGLGWDRDEAPPLWPWRQVISGLMGAVGVRSQGSVDRIHSAHEVLSASAASGVDIAGPFALFETVVTGVREVARAATAVLVFENMDLADASTLKLLRVASAALRGDKVLLVITCNETNVPRSLRPLASELRREACALDLAPLDIEGVARLYEHATGAPPSQGVIESIATASGGNPLFVQELARLAAVRGDVHRPDHSVGFRVPDTLRDVFRRRSSLLSSAAAECLSVAAAMGVGFRAAELEVVTEIDAATLRDLLDEAVDLHLIEDAGSFGEYVFNHVLIREALYEDLPASKRMRLHRRIAEALESLYSPIGNKHVAQLAHHWFKAAQAGDPARTLEFTRRAAEASVAVGAIDEAERLYRRAIRVAEISPALTPEIPSLQRALDDLRDKLGVPIADEPSGQTFWREGDYWTVRFGGKTIRLRDSRGLQYLAQLLSNPGRELHVMDIVGTAVLSTVAHAVAHEDALNPALATGEPLLDPIAKREYKRRLDDLREEAEEARAFNDTERAARLESEIEALVGHLKAAIGLGGRDRRATSDVERARTNVTKAVRTTLSRIEKEHTDLAQHLRATIRTGTYCSYMPDPRAGLPWHVS